MGEWALLATACRWWLQIKMQLKLNISRVQLWNENWLWWGECQLKSCEVLIVIQNE